MECAEDGEPFSQKASFLEAEISRPVAEGSAGNHVIKQVDLQYPGSFAQPASQPEIGFTWGRLARGVVVYQDERVS
jgi:hypothetical protein